MTFYMQAEVEAQIAKGKGVFICQTQSDADILIKKGCVATVSNGGLPDIFKDRNVVLVRPKDPASDAVIDTLFQLFHTQGAHPVVIEQESIVKHGKKALASIIEWSYEDAAEQNGLLENAQKVLDARPPPIVKRKEYTKADETPLDVVAGEVERPRTNLIKWPELAGQEPPPFEWIMEHWLSWHPTLLAGRGGIGKSLLIQQILTQLACGHPTWCASQEPLRVLYWACEDDHDQLWRRQDAICRSIGIQFDALANLHIDARYGLDNTLMSSEFGKPMWTPMIETLREQVNDLKIDVLAIDNLGHTFGANENTRHDVTKFLNGICGLVEKRKFCPIVLGHPSKGPESTYSGSTAWENAVRMRWYLDDKLPDQKADESEKPDPNYRILAKRKANYTTKDYVQFRYDGGVLVPDIDQYDDVGMVAQLRKRRARQIVAAAVDTLDRINIYGSRKVGRNYLPAVILENKLAEGFSKPQLGEAMRDMVLAQELVEQVVGKNSARMPILGLKNAIK